MKKLLVFFMALGLCIGLLGCTETGIQDTQSGNTENQNIIVTETTNVTETAETTKTTEATKATESTEATETTEATKTTEATEVTKTTETTQKDPDDVQETMVWIPTKGGKKYHSSKSCSGMEDPDYVAKSQAEQQGFAPCKKCYK